MVTKQVHIPYINHVCWHRWLYSCSLCVCGNRTEKTHLITWPSHKRQ